MPSRVLVFRDYRVRVYDPQQDKHVVFKTRSVSPEQADDQARHGYTGLLGGPELVKIREQLDVEVEPW